jgi:hypothetical protein
VARRSSSRGQLEAAGQALRGPAVADAVAFIVAPAIATDDGAQGLPHATCWQNAELIRVRNRDQPIGMRRLGLRRRRRLLEKRRLEVSRRQSQLSSARLMPSLDRRLGGRRHRPRGDGTTVRPTFVTSHSPSSPRLTSSPGAREWRTQHRSSPVSTRPSATRSSRGPWICSVATRHRSSDGCSFSPPADLHSASSSRPERGDAVGGVVPAITLPPDPTLASHCAVRSLVRREGSSPGPAAFAAFQRPLSPIPVDGVRSTA